MNSSRPSSRNGACRLCRTRSAMTVASRGVADVVEQQRELVAARAARPCRWAAAPLRAGAPPPAAAGRRTAWPRQSLMTLKRSRSRNSTAAQHSGWWRWARRIDWSRRSTNSTRFGRPVSASWSASCCRRRSASRRSVTSVIEPTIAGRAAVRRRGPRSRARASSGSRRRGAACGARTRSGRRRCRVSVGVERLRERRAVVGVDAAEPLAARLADLDARGSRACSSSAAE